MLTSSSGACWNNGRLKRGVLGGVVIRLDMDMARGPPFAEDTLPGMGVTGKPEVYGECIDGEGCGE